MTKLDQWTGEKAQKPSPDDLCRSIREAMADADIDYLRTEIPNAVDQTQEGVDRVTEIVRAMKEFAHPGTKEKNLVNLNQSLEYAIVVSRNEWKYVAEMETDLDPRLPLVNCLPGELSQVFLNVIVNAAHAIAATAGDGSGGKRGKIRITTREKKGFAEIRIGDTGPGIPQEIQSRIFDPFFTTKAVGKGTGQGLAISRSVVVDKHGGELTFETEPDQGTVFLIRLPLIGERPHDGAKETDPIR